MRKNLEGLLELEEGSDDYLIIQVLEQVENYNPNGIGKFRYGYGNSLLINDEIAEIYDSLIAKNPSIVKKRGGSSEETVDPDVWSLAENQVRFEYLSRFLDIDDADKMQAVFLESYKNAVKLELMGSDEFTIDLEKIASDVLKISHQELDRIRSYSKRFVDGLSDDEKTNFISRYSHNGRNWTREFVSTDDGGSYISYDPTKMH